MQRFRVDLKTFLGLSMPNQCCHAVRKLIFGRFLGGIFGQETPNLIDPYIYVVLPYYMICTQCFMLNLTLTSRQHLLAYYFLLHKSKRQS